MLTERERERYRRQIPLFGEAGQQRLGKARVAVVGAGGLGCPAALYLAAAGIGEIRLVDPDRVERSNLNRQVLHHEGDVGRPKVASAAEKLLAQNPGLTVSVRHAAIDEKNAEDLIGDADIVVDAVDDFATRYLLNRAALAKGIPLVHGAVSGFDGQVTTVLPGRTACLRCIFPVPPPKESVPVVGATAGVVGLIQANEVIKYVTGTGDPLKGRLLLWDGRSASTVLLSVERQEDCADCGSGAHR
ncbi:HesA/MoeB/ThiF family protein [Methanoculleus sp. FWC-SCC1]|uniref:HesA/MoeB/ThiF family protein n=1 Tax=Methanoculleus frigidifontis TaxID=2584085 RepID=A0ABT8MDG5_9EURY|nr:HesA/MoeB/ThiF family protein [Methanoculleus sp. FWC-SCC1]MDN7025971.1 HesA/MoeB/ThiF family protein [Methanoculleus sp. FWC-SCC1]